ncbi:Pyrimidine 1 isoform 1 [Hibiscus syriacus]|uniref:Pyrimidine 1 isoform 1 n=1 Tax=Hibiscus syriacus TaxID=106335 RepID=A0A6A3DB91_HIBSY|nr:Pyrimidine 1 isoform 1 [Hibiscus syriacus]
MELNNDDDSNFSGKEDMSSVAIHSQVSKIKQESEQIIDWSPGQPEMRPVLREISRRQISRRSPLGLSGSPISVVKEQGLFREWEQGHGDERDMHAWVIPKMGLPCDEFCYQTVPTVLSEGEQEMEANKSEDHHQEEEAGDRDDVELLKTIISSHPLYGRLVENHLNCLKVGGIGNSGTSSKGSQSQAEVYNSSNNIKKNPCSSSMQLNQSELDLFMVDEAINLDILKHMQEGYCSALTKLKEVMEEPQLETIAFINAMHSQLRDLAGANPFSPDVFLCEGLIHIHSELVQQEAETNNSNEGSTETRVVECCGSSDAEKPG